MKIKNLLATATVITGLGLILPIQAENISHLTELLNTKQCPQCDLINAGLVLADLSGANLSGANLTHANLSRANLVGANLRGANLTGTSLYGANLGGADLSGAIFNGTDLRDAYLAGATLDEVNLDRAYVQGATGISMEAATPEQFHRWGLAEATRGNYEEAMNHYNRALSIDPNFAPAYLGRGLAYFNQGNAIAAAKNAEMAAHLFETENNTAGYETAQNLIKGVEATQKENNGGGGGNFGQIFQSVASLVFKFLLK